VSARHRDTALLLALAALKLAVHVLTNGQYGFHRDELATLDDARHLAWGYVAYPPLTPFLGRISLELFGASLAGARLFPALALSLSVLLSGLIARELGGGRAAQLTAALAVAIGPVVLGASALLQYVAFDHLWWVLVAYLLIRLANSGDRRYWLAIGAVLGIAVETKYTIGLCATGIVLGVLVARRADLRSPWLWAGAALALLLLVPNLAWQARNDFVSVSFLRSIHERDVRIGRTADFLSDQLVVAANPVTIPLWIAGLGWLFLSRGRRQPMLATMLAASFVLLWLLKGRGYYAAPLYPPLLAAGAVAVEDWIGRLSASMRRLVRSTEWLLFAVGAGVSVIALPIAPPGSSLWRFACAQNQDLAEQVGWPELVRTVAGVYAALPAAERSRARILTGNYGEAGAIDLYGPELGLPPAISGVNSYWARGYGEPPPETLIVLGIGREALDRRFASCAWAARVPNPLEVRNEESEDHPDVFLCRELRTSWPEFWRDFRHFG